MPAGNRLFDLELGPVWRFGFLPACGVKSRQVEMGASWKRRTARICRRHGGLQGALIGRQTLITARETCSCAADSRAPRRALSLVGLARRAEALMASVMFSARSTNSSRHRDRKPTTAGAINNSGQQLRMRRNLLVAQAED